MGMSLILKRTIDTRYFIARRLLAGIDRPRASIICRAHAFLLLMSVYICVKLTLPNKTPRYLTEASLESFLKCVTVVLKSELPRGRSSVLDALILAPVAASCILKQSLITVRSDS